MSVVYTRNIAFTKTPLKKEYQFSDYFKIYPFSYPNGPTAENPDHFPCMVELTYLKSEVKNSKPFDLPYVDEMLSTTATQTNKLIEVCNLLSVVTNFRFFFYRHPSGMWSIPINEESKKNADKLVSTWSFPLFYYPTMANDFKIGQTFSETKISKVTLVNRRRYYFFDPVESKDKEVDFPEDIDQVIDSYRSLSPEDKLICDSAIHLLCNGLDLADSMRSLSFLSIVSSIETLVHYEFKHEKVSYECGDCKTLKESGRNCKKCGRPIWGVAAKFREFLFKYVSNIPAAKKMYDKIYSVRSKIAHTEYLIDGETYLNWDYTNKTEEIQLTHLEAIQLSRRAISNWLRFKTSKKEVTSSQVTV